MKMRKFGDEFVQMRFIFNIINSVDSRGFDYCTMLMVDGQRGFDHRGTSGNFKYFF